MWAGEKPGISVIMGVYNQWDREALRKSVGSILNQSFRDFEFIIYDDGSAPEAARYLRELEDMDPRIVLIGQEENRGLAFSLNTCIAQSHGKYIARMDADDISMPERLLVQYRFLEEHPEYAWCGCNTELFDREGVWGCRRMPEVPEDKDYLPFSPYVHPSVMYRRSLFDEQGGYLVSPETRRCEDYEIFMRLHRAGCRGYNIQENLFCYREDQESFQRRRFGCRINEAKLRFRSFRAMGLLFPAGWAYVLRPVLGGLIPASVAAWLKRRQSGYGRKYEEKTEAAMLQENLAEKSGML